MENDVEKRQEKSQLNLDHILLEVGQFGKYQMKTTALCSIYVVFIAWTTSEYVFTTSRINSRCLIPECEDSTHVDFAPQWILNAVPGTNLESFDNCQRYANTSASVISDDICPAQLFDTITLQTCEEYVYENRHSVVYDFDLACDEWSRSSIGSIQTLGNMLALPITGFLSDKWGRKTALVINAFNSIWLGIVRYWAGSYFAFAVSKFVEAAFGAGGYSCAYILLTELVGPEYRILVGAIMSTAFSFGQILLGLISWAVPNWRNLTLALYMPQIIVISYYWLISESIRWYMSKGRYEQSEKVLKELAKANGKVLSDKTLTALRLSAEEEKERKALDKDSESEPWLVIEVFRYKKILLRCLVSPIWWITCILTYYGLAVNAVNMSGNRHLNFVAVAAAEIPGHWLSLYLMGKVGRKPVLICAFWFCAVCLTGFVFIPDDLSILSLIVYLLGVCCNAMVVIAVYLYTAEIYPTKHRHSLFAFSSMIGRTGSILAPLTPAIGAATFFELPFLIFAGLAFLSGSLVFLTPETFGTTLPDTMEEASNINKKK